MRILLDTQLAFWWLTDPARLPDSARRLLLAADTEAWISHVSLWELAIKQQAGRAQLDLARFTAQVELDGFRLLSVTTEHVQSVTDMQAVPDACDAFDRLLLAQCLAEPLVLLTTDRALAAYGVPVRMA